MVLEARNAELQLDELRVSPYNVRGEPGDVSELAESIRQIGVLQPILVRESQGGGYEVVIGSRRLAASKQAGLSTIPAIIKELDDSQALVESLSENIQRGDLTEEEIARCYTALEGLNPGRWSQEAFARRIGKSRQWVGGILAAYHTLEQLRGAGFTGGMKAYPRREEREAGTLPISHLQEIDSAMRSEEVQRTYGEEQLQEKRVELAETIRDLDHEDARRVTDYFKMYPDRPMEEVREQGLARSTGIRVQTFISPRVQREVEETARERGTTPEMLYSEVIEKGLAVSRGTTAFAPTPTGLGPMVAPAAPSQSELEWAKAPTTALDVGFRIESQILDLAGSLDPQRLQGVPEGQKMKVVGALHVLLDKIRVALADLSGERIEVPQVIEGSVQSRDD